MAGERQQRRHPDGLDDLLVAGGSAVRRGSGGGDRGELSLAGHADRGGEEWRLLDGDGMVDGTGEISRKGGR